MRQHLAQRAAEREPRAERPTPLPLACAAGSLCLSIGFKPQWTTSARVATGRSTRTFGMRVNLQQLLRDRGVVNPTRVQETTFREDELRIRLMGPAWWTPYQDHACERRIDLIFQGVGEGHLDPTDFASADDKDFEHLEIAEISQVPWVQQNGTAIFCSAPIPKPLELYFVIHDFLIAQGSMRTAEHYLNSRGDSRHFRRVVQSQAYLLGSRSGFI